MYKKIFLVVSIVINIVMCNINIAYATNESDTSISDVFTGAQSFLNQADNQTTIDTDKLQNTSNMLYRILLVLGMCIAVIVSVILGIKFMIGSVEEKAQVKDQLIPFVVGCIVIFGAFTIWSIVVNIGNQIEGTTTQSTQSSFTCKHCGKSVTRKQLNQGVCPSCGGTI